MKAFILAAGAGERLRPLTDILPKCLVSIRNLPMLGIWLELCRHNGIEEVLVNTHAHAKLVRHYLRNNNHGVRVQITYEDQLLGSAGTVLSNRDWIGTAPEFWVFYGDVLTNVNIQRMLQFHRLRKQIATLGVYEVANPTQCGIVSLDEEHIIQEFVEKPAKPRGKLGFSGVMIATPALFDAIPKQIPVDLGRHVFPKLVGRMAAYPISEYLVDIGTPAAYQQAQLTWPGLSAAAQPECSCSRA